MSTVAIWGERGLLLPHNVSTGTGFALTSYDLSKMTVFTLQFLACLRNLLARSLQLQFSCYSLSGLCPGQPGHHGLFWVDSGPTWKASLSLVFSPVLSP